ncbi:Uncharacterised protein [Staphylococcus epidermidis]|nr:Uncharacterised protein [Staphylococcus epidermidis]
MKIVVIGATGTIGKSVSKNLKKIIMKLLKLAVNLVIIN